MRQHLWKDKAACLGLNNNLFFDDYEEKIEVRDSVDTMCKQCDVRKICFANGISGKEWGIWGGVYLENGEVSREFNKHKSKKDWAGIWESLTMEKDNV